MPKPPEIPAAVRNFDALPDCARVRLPVVMALTGLSESTVLRRAQSGEMPRPVKIGGTQSWRVGDLRKMLGEVAA